MELKHSRKHEQKLRWLDDHAAYLDATYPGMWVAIADAGLAGIGKTMAEAEDAAAEKGFTDILLTGVKREEYQGVYLIR